MKIPEKKPTYEQIKMKADAFSWRISFKSIIKEIIESVVLLKDRLKDNLNFQQKSLPELRRLYKQVNDLVKNNQETQNYDTKKEMELVQTMINIINEYGQQTNVFAGVKRRLTRAIAGSQGPATITSYYYTFGKDPSFSTAKLINI